MTASTPLPHSSAVRDASRDVTHVRVPGSTSNLGPGFDCLGLALSLTLEAHVIERHEAPGHLYRSRVGSASEWTGGPEDLFLLAVDVASRRIAEEPGWVFDVSSEIPIARGLGSSGAAVAAGLLLGRELGGDASNSLDLDVLVGLGLELEGHPDNVVASLLGGLTLGVPTPEARSPLTYLSAPLHDTLGVVVAWSSHRTPTEVARRVLPDQVPFSDAIENPRRLALLLAGLRDGRLDWIETGSQDRLHERHRLPLVPGGAATLAAMRQAGAPLATLSGSGSALVAVATLTRLAAIRDAAEVALRRDADEVVARVLEVVREPAGY